MSDSSNSTSTPVERIQFGFFCDVHTATPCPETLLPFVGDVHKLAGNAFFCINCPIYLAEIERKGARLQ